MTKPVDQRVAVILPPPERPSLAREAAESAPGWVLAACGAIATISFTAELGWHRTVPVAVLFVLLPAVIWVCRRVAAAYRLRTAEAAVPIGRRYHGTLDVITDSARRQLRPIGTTARDVAGRTGALVADLDIPEARIFQGLRPVGGNTPPVAHAISVGRRLILVESVVWPPGCYETGDDGRVLCDGTYIGQSANALLGAVRHWRAALPRSHRVSAVVVVHPTTKGHLALPPALPGELAWVAADEAVSRLQLQLARGRRTVSRRAVAALMAATVERP